MLIRRANLKDVLQPWGAGTWMCCRRPGATQPSELLGSQAMEDLLRRLEASYDAVVIDAPPLLP